MSPRSEERRRLLQQAVHSFAQAHPDYTMARIEREMARAVGLSPSSVQKWRAGYPIASDHIPTLAEWAVRQAGMELLWLRAFLRQCGYGEAGLEARLLGSEGSLVCSEPDEQSRPAIIPVPEYLHLFGVDLLIQRLFALLSDPQGPRLVSLEGLGGIGKTALARAVTHRLRERGEAFESVCWISARHLSITSRGELERLDDPARSVHDVVTRLADQLGQRHLAGLSTADKLSRLQPLLNETPHLVVVDNLETMSDVQDLLPALQPLAGVSRFLFTSRCTLHHFPYVHVFPVPRLSVSDSQALIRSELDRRGYVEHLSQETVDDLYSLIGGLPLALKLTAAQIGRLPARSILEGLRRGHHQAPQAMYAYIYRQAWSQLKDSARQLLLSMLNVSADGEDLAWIRLTSLLPPSEFEAALAQLLDYSLLETVRALPEPNYRLHRLTVTFLQSEILLDWEEDHG